MPLLTVFIRARRRDHIHRPFCYLHNIKAPRLFWSRTYTTIILPKKHTHTHTLTIYEKSGSQFIMSIFLEKGVVHFIEMVNPTGKCVSICQLFYDLCFTFKRILFYVKMKTKLLWTFEDKILLNVQNGFVVYYQNRRFNKNHTHSSCYSELTVQNRHQHSAVTLLFCGSHNGIWKGTFFYWRSKRTITSTDTGEVILSGIVVLYLIGWAPEEFSYVDVYCTRSYNSASVLRSFCKAVGGVIVWVPTLKNKKAEWLFEYVTQIARTFRNSRKIQHSPRIFSDRLDFTFSSCKVCVKKERVVIWLKKLKKYHLSILGRRV